MEKTDRTMRTMPHHMFMQDRKLLEMSGVSDVDSFDDAVVVAYTALGAIRIRGRGLHVKKLSLEEGTLSVEGDIDAVTYDDNGNVIPLSERFNENEDDIRFRKKEQHLKPSPFKMNINRLSFQVLMKSLETALPEE